MFVVLDGPDGAGKSSLAQSLAQDLTERGHKVCMTAEPYLPTTRAWLSNKVVTARELAIAFAHDRHRHIHEEVAPALAAGFIVICDRYYLSTEVYQKLHNDPAFVDALLADALEPDLMLVVDAPTDVCMQRLAGTGKVPDRYEAKAELQARVRQSYLRLASQRGFPVIDGSRSPDASLADAVALVLDRLARKAKTSWCAAAMGETFAGATATGVLGC